MVIFQDKKSLKVGISCGQSLDLEGPTSLVMGPDPSSVLQATRFRKLWGESNCQVRRFQDGSLRETVPIEGPFRLINGDSVAEKADHAVDASDFVLHRWIHLIRIHCQPKEVRVARPLNNLPDLLKECYARAGQTRALRAKTQDFINLLTGLSSDAVRLHVRRSRTQTTPGGRLGAPGPGGAQGEVPLHPTQGLPHTRRHRNHLKELPQAGPVHKAVPLSPAAAELRTCISGCARRRTVWRHPGGPLQTDPLRGQGPRGQVGARGTNQPGGLARDTPGNRDATPMLVGGSHANATLDQVKVPVRGL